MAIKKEEKSTERQMIFTTEIVEEMTRKLNDGYILKRWQNPWEKSQIGLRREGIKFGWTEEEIKEFAKCAEDIVYFCESYCQLKREDGTVGHIKVRDYQADMLNAMVNNRFLILLASRQISKTTSTAMFMIWTICFNSNKNIMIVANKQDTASEIVDKIKNIYMLLPFYMKPGVKNWAQKSLIFDNGCRIMTSARSKSPAIGFTIDVLYMDEFAHIPSNIIEPFYTAAYPTVSAVKNSKIIISSTPNGMNLFYRLLTAAELPEDDPNKNNYKAMRVYWYQVPGRFVTYIKIKKFKMRDYELNDDFVEQQIRDKFEKIAPKIEKRLDRDKGSWIYEIYNDENCTEQDVKTFKILDNKGIEMPIQNISFVSTWKEDTMKDIGGEDAFNQEYGLRFINASKSLISEQVVDSMFKNLVSYEHIDIPDFNEQIKFSYHNLKWNMNNDIFNPENRLDYKIVISIDIAEGLGLDYSVMNIFKVEMKNKDIIHKQKNRYQSLKDFFCITQIGLLHDNHMSIKQFATISYLVIFKYFNPENVMVIIENNTYGSQFLLEMTHVFDDNNDYDPYVFLTYKPNINDDNEIIGIKLRGQKGLIVKEYQTKMDDYCININEENSIKEVTTFVKNVTPAGNVKYEADSGHDDIAMTIVEASTVFEKDRFFEICEEIYDNMNDEDKNYIDKILDVTLTEDSYISYNELFGSVLRPNSLLRPNNNYQVRI